jgi:hypothetical protein
VSGDPSQRLVSSTEDGGDSELELCARLLRALSHRIRGDLAVVTNDLVYLSSLVDPVELERPRARCETIASLLSPLGLLTTTGRYEPTSMLSLSEILGLTLDRSVDPSRTVLLSTALLRQAVQLLRQLFGPWAGLVQEGEAAARAIACILRFQGARSLRAGYSSVSQMAAAELGERFVVEACLVDVILRDHLWSVKFSCHDKQLVCMLTVNRR